MFGSNYAKIAHEPTYLERFGGLACAEPLAERTTSPHDHPTACTRTPVQYNLLGFLVLRRGERGEPLPGGDSVTCVRAVVLIDAEKSILAQSSVDSAAKQS